MKGRAREKGKAKATKRKGGKRGDEDEGLGDDGSGGEDMPRTINKRERKEERRKQQQKGAGKVKRGGNKGASAPSSTTEIAKKPPKINGYMKRKLAKSNDGEVSNSEMIDQLPPEVWTHIVSFIGDNETLLNFRLACQHFRWFALICRSHFALNASRYTWESLPMESLFHFLSTNCPRLHSIDLRDCIKLTEFPQLAPTLRSIDLTGCINLPDSALKALPSTVKELNLSGCASITNDMAAFLPPELTVLNLNDCFSITEAIFPHLPTTLRSLSLKMCQLSSVEGLPRNLKELQFTVDFGMKRKEATLEPLTTLTSLERLSLEGSPRLTPEDAAHFPTSLRRLDISDCTNITEEIFEKLPPNLDVLEMRGFPRLSGDMSTLPRYLRVIDLGSAKPPEGGLLGLPNSLQVLKLNACYPVNQALLQNLPPDLAELRLSWCRTLKNDTLEFLPQKLKVLDLSECSPYVDDAAVQWLPSTLEVLDIVGVDALTDAGLKAIAAKMPNLRKLLIATRAPMISKQVVRNLPSKMEVITRPSVRRTIMKEIGRG